MQLRSDVPVGAYLSGGMDSSIVTLLAAPHAVASAAHVHRRLPRRARVRRELAMLARSPGVCGARMHEIVPTEQQFVDLLPRMVYQMDEPVAGPGLFPQFVVARCAARTVKVVLGGQGGDEIFGGYARYLVAYLEQAIKGAIFESTEEAEHIVSLKSIVPNLPALAAIRTDAAALLAAGCVRADGSPVFPADRPERRVAAISSATTSGPPMTGRRLFARFQSVFNHPDTKSYYNKMTHFDLVTGLPALLHVEDRVSMACLAGVASPAPRPLARRPRDEHATAHEVPRRRAQIHAQAIDAPICSHGGRRAQGQDGIPGPAASVGQGRSRATSSPMSCCRSTRASADCSSPQAVERLLDDEFAFGRRLWGLVNLELWFREFIDA